ncbi:ribosome maturation factor RimP [Clostridium neuense]|uniref:Ribosome maturation factor RimP n=1 Tax=Clostridium neuense TaxID=1728934 RepID=A0ABW8TD22_9CLOT
MLEEVEGIIKKEVEELGYEFYHLELVNESGENYLRVYIDSPNGIGLDDCEKVSRKVSDILDEKDPIPYSYYLEVSSAGIFRTLFTDEHLKRYNGSMVKLKIKGTFTGKKEFLGNLNGFDDESVSIVNNNEIIKIPRKKIKRVTLEGEL